MSDRPWLSSYPAGMPAEIEPLAFANLPAFIEDCCQRYPERTAFSFMGRDFSYAEFEQQTHQLAAYLQALGLVKGDRVAVMLPNVAQYPVTVAAILRAGYVVVNVNPLYKANELEHQLNNAGAKAIVILENFAATLAQCLPRTPVQHIVLCTMGDTLGLLKGAAVNFVVRVVKKLVPDYRLPHFIAFRDALKQGKRCTLETPPLAPDDVAVLQYTGGTTGVAKGAMLSHRNLMSNVMQSFTWYQPAIQKIPAGEQMVTVCALPLYHIFAFTVCMMLSLRAGGKVVLIPNARDFKGTLKELTQHRVHIFPGVNTLFNALAQHPDFNTVDWSHLKISVGGGAAVQSTTAKIWLEKTGSPICQGYGLSETSPCVTCNPVSDVVFNGTIGLPMPSTEIRLLDDQGQEVPLGQPGEISIKGPQVMSGYWENPAETANAFTEQGYFKTGDIGVADENGYIKIVDRKKDMILVSGFNVYPNEIEEIVSQLAGVKECAAVGVVDEKTGEAVKLVIVKSPELTEAMVREHCKKMLTGYKQPRLVEFREALPKTPVGKVLRRELRG